MYVPTIHDEAAGYAEYVVQQLEALRASAFGLTEEQARLTPTRSALPSSTSAAPPWSSGSARAIRTPSRRCRRRPGTA